MALDRKTALRNRSASLIIALLISAMFFGFVFSGYYLLLSRSIFLAIFGGIFMASIVLLLAWWLGMHEKGWLKFWPLTLLLLGLSALGVFNSLMLNFEGRYVFMDAIEGAQSDFQRLGSLASGQLKETGVSDRLAKVDALKFALIDEINNPKLCGEGPRARQIISNLKDTLPGFEELSGAGVDCSKNDEIVRSYKTKIDALIPKAEWNKPALVSVLVESMTARDELRSLYGKSSGALGGALIRQVKPELERLDDRYRGLYEILQDQTKIPADLDNKLPLTAVHSLGEMSQVHVLLAERRSKFTTWLYFALALALDSLVIYCWSVVRGMRDAGPPIIPRSQSQRAW